MTAGLILKRAKVSRPSGQWRDDDFNVLEDDGPELLARLAGLPFRLCISNRTHGHCETKDAGRSTTQQGATTPLGGGVPAAERSSAGQQILSSELARSTDAAELRLTGPFGGSNVAANPRDRNAATQAPS